MFCFRCGARIEPGIQFCRECGTESISAPDPLGTLGSVGAFLAGILIFAVVFLAVSFVLSSLFATAGPQLVIVTLGFLAGLLAGATSLLYVKSKSQRVTIRKTVGGKKEVLDELGSEPQLQLPENFVHQPASVTEMTTRKLNVR